MNSFFKPLILMALIPFASMNAKTLSNGIELPDVWPPRYKIADTAKEMDVPYLREKPSVIPVNVGRQLFVDDFLISHTDMERVFHTPNFYKNNPVVEPDRSWENTSTGAKYAAPFSDGIWYDDNTGTFKMWYLAGAGSLYKEDGQSFYTGYAESKDGKHWEKTLCDIYPGTNIVDTCNRDAATIWLDRFEKNPAQRYKMFNIERRPSDRRWQIILKYSEDGIHWSKGVAQSGDMSDRTTAFYNPFTNKWALSMRASTPVSSRSRFYIENEDPETLVSFAHRIRTDAADKNIVFWFTPDDKELRHEEYPEVNPGIYNFDCIAYESIILGQYSAWSGPENRVCEEQNIQKRNVVSLGYSRDGFHFSRPTHQPFMNVNETDGAWNWGNMQSINGTPLIVGDSLYFYSSGRRLNDVMWDSHVSTGLATLRRDGFISMHAGKKECTLTTETLEFDGRYLFVNVDLKGKLFFDVLNEDGNVIKGFSKKEIKYLRNVNSTKILVADLELLKDKKIRIKFYMTQGDLYSFWISKWESGESRGYTAGGGPGLSPSGVDVPEITD